MDADERTRLRAQCAQADAAPVDWTAEDQHLADGDTAAAETLRRERDEARAGLAHALRIVQGFADGAAMPEARDAARAILDAIRARGAR